MGFEPLEDRTLPSFSVASTVPANGAVFNSAPQDYIVNFSAAIDTTTLDASDFKVTDNSGTPQAANSFTINSPTQVDFQYNSAPFTSIGSHTMSMAAGSVLDTSANPLTASSKTVKLTTATHFAISVPSTATAGTSFTVTVTALDANNNTATDYPGSVHFTSSDSLASLPGNSTLTSGTKNFTVTLKTAAGETL
ncbi:MAG TPA: hypothetical protein VE988_14860, partial [Gemmataceae bacterium]|nr:hypothetical protein [Gemmataceae bacterium]